MTEKTLKDCIDVIKNSLEKKAEVGGTVSFKQVTVSNDLSVVGTAWLNGPTVAQKDLSVNGTTWINGAGRVNSDFTINGTTYLNGATQTQLIVVNRYGGEGGEIILKGSRDDLPDFHLDEAGGYARIWSSKNNRLVTQWSLT